MSRVGTVLILEVPGTEIYDQNFSGLVYEHQQSSLEILVARFGFFRLGFSWEMCSRNFGFAAAFVYTGEDKAPKTIAYKDVRNKYVIGRQLQNTSNADYPKEFILNHALDKYSLLVFWGINANFETIFKFLKKSEQIFIALDSNPDKFIHVGSEVKCFLPEYFISNFNQIIAQEFVSYEDICFVVTASAHAETIFPKISPLGTRVLIYDPI